AIAHHDLGLLDRQSVLGKGLGDVARADRTVQFALGGGVGVDGDARAVDLGQARLGLVGDRLGLGLVLGAARLELGSVGGVGREGLALRDRKSTRLNSSHVKISYAVFC